MDRLNQHRSADYLPAFCTFPVDMARLVSFTTHLDILVSGCISATTSLIAVGLMDGGSCVDRVPPADIYFKLSNDALDISQTYFVCPALQRVRGLVRPRKPMWLDPVLASLRNGFRWGPRPGQDPKFYCECLQSTA